jgi:hypothetical protein
VAPLTAFQEMLTWPFPAVALTPSGAAGAEVAAGAEEDAASSSPGAQPPSAIAAMKIKLRQEPRISIASPNGKRSCGQCEFAGSINPPGGGGSVDHSRLPRAERQSNPRFG